MHVMPHDPTHFFCRLLNRSWNRALQDSLRVGRFCRCNMLAADIGLTRDPWDMPGIAEVWLCQLKGDEFSASPRERSVTSHYGVTLYDPKL